MRDGSNEVRSRTEVADECLGYRRGTATLVATFEELAGSDQLRFTTPLKLSHVLSRGGSFISQAFRICPECRHPNSGVEYGLLAHQVKVVLHCPLHRVRLLERCLGCGNTFSPRHFAPTCDICFRCGIRLSDQRLEAIALSSYSKWCEQQGKSLVEFVTDPEVDAPPSDWQEAYFCGLSRLIDRGLVQYTAQERVVLREIHRDLLHEGAQPRLETLLRIASIQAVGVCELISSPVESCSPRLLNIGEARSPKRSRPNHAQERWELVRAKIESIMETDERMLMESKEKIVRRFGLSVSGFWQHYRELSIAYDRERHRRSRLLQDAKKKLIQEAVELLVEERRESGKPIHIREDGDELRKNLGMPKRAVEIALREASLKR